MLCWIYLAWGALCHQSRHPYLVVVVIVEDQLRVRNFSLGLGVHPHFLLQTKVAFTDIVVQEPGACKVVVVVIVCFIKKI